MLCGSCKKTKDASAFKTTKQCETCYEKNKAYYQANKEQLKAKQRARNAAKREAMRMEKEEKRKELEEIKRIAEEEKRKQHEEKKRVAKEERAHTLAKNAEIPKYYQVCPYEQLRLEGITTKYCKGCKKNKVLQEFRLVTRLGVDQLAPTCTGCFNKSKASYEIDKEEKLAKAREYKIANAERIKERRREYLQETRDWVYQREKAYWARNRDRMNAVVAEYHRTNKHQRLRSRISSRLREKIKKLKSTKEYLGCGGDIEVLLKWIEHQFTEEMSWDNYGKHWHLDHVLPINKFNIDDEEEVHICFSWMNMQPLERLANISKHDKIIPDMVNAHIDKLIAYGTVAECQDEVNAYLKKYITIYNNQLALKV